MTSDLKDRIIEVLRTEAAPALDLDGSLIEVVGVKDGVVELRMSGLCINCPASIMGLMIGLEAELRQRIPEIEYVEMVP